MSDEKLLTYADFAAKFREHNVEYNQRMITADSDDGIDNARYIDNKIIIPIWFIKKTSQLPDPFYESTITCDVQNIDENDPNINHRLATGANVHITVTNPTNNIQRIRFMLCDQDGNGWHDYNGNFMYTGVIAIDLDQWGTSVWGMMEAVKLSDQKIYIDKTRQSEQICSVECETNTLYYYGKNLEYTLEYDPTKPGIWGNPFSVKASESDDLITYKAYFKPKRQSTSLNLGYLNQSTLDFSKWGDYNHDPTASNQYPILLNNITIPSGTNLNNTICYLFNVGSYTNTSQPYCSEVFTIMTITGNRPRVIQGVVANGVWMNSQASLAYNKFNLTKEGPLVDGNGKYRDAIIYLLLLLTNDSDKEYFQRTSIPFILKTAVLMSDYVVAYDCLEPITVTSN